MMRKQPSSSGPRDALNGCDPPLTKFRLRTSVWPMTAHVHVGTGMWKISSIENPEHPGCIGGRLRPSCKALVDMAGALQVDPKVTAAALQQQMMEQVKIAHYFMFTKLRRTCDVVL